MQRSITATFVISNHDIHYVQRVNDIQGGSNMTGTDLCVNKPHCLFTHKSVPVIFEPPCRLENTIHPTVVIRITCPTSSTVVLC